jgi:uncharacterized protein YkwD
MRQTFPALVMVALLAACGGADFEVGDAQFEGEEVFDLEELPLDEVPDDEFAQHTDELSGCALNSTAETSHVRRINNARSSRGIATLPVRDCIRKVARAWSLKMCREGRLYHNPNYVRQIANNCGSNWKRMGENVGRGASELSIYNAFWNSSGHRANMLNREFNRLGVGIYQAGNGTMFIAQNYARY